MGIVQCMHSDPWEAIVRSVTTRATGGTQVLPRLATRPRPLTSRCRATHRGQASPEGWTSVRHTCGSTNPRQVKGYAYQALVAVAKLRLSEIAPFSWGDPS